jgi:hypothetical protein
MPSQYGKFFDFCRDSGNLRATIPGKSNLCVFRGFPTSMTIASLFRQSILTAFTVCNVRIIPLSSPFNFLRGSLELYSKFLGQELNLRAELVTLRFSPCSKYFPQKSNANYYQLFNESPARRGNGAPGFGGCNLDGIHLSDGRYLANLGMLL